MKFTKSDTPPIVKPLLRMAVPSMVGAVILSAVPIVEGWFVGALGAGALASVALVFPLYMLSNMISAGAIGGAVAGATARALGSGDEAAVRAILLGAFILSAVVGGFAALLVLVFGRDLFALLGGAGEVLENAVRYGDILFAGIVLLMLFNFLSSILRGAGDMKAPAIGMIIVASVHGIVSWDAVARWGLEGAAIALLVGYGVGCLFVLSRLFSSSSPVSITGLWRIEPSYVWSVMVPVVRAGLLASVQSVTTIFMAVLLTGFAGQLGTKALAGYGLGSRLELLMIPIIFGFGSAAIAMAGKAVGAGDRDHAIRIAWTGAGLAMVFVGSLGIVAAIFPQIWTGIFTADKEVADVTSRYLSIVGPFYGFFALGLALYFSSQALRTLGWPVVGTILRLAVLIAGLVLVDGATSEPDTLFTIIAVAMAIYGVFIASALKLGPWGAQARD